MSNRREFIVQFSLGTSALLASQAFAQGAMVADADPQAAALGYKADGTKTDKTKFPKYAAGQQCSSCALLPGTGGRQRRIQCAGSRMGGAPPGGTLPMATTGNAGGALAERPGQ